MLLHLSFPTVLRKNNLWLRTRRKSQLLPDLAMGTFPGGAVPQTCGRTSPAWRGGPPSAGCWGTLALPKHMKSS